MSVEKMTPEQYYAVKEMLEKANDQIMGIASGMDVLLECLRPDSSYGTVSYTTFSNKLGDVQGNINRMKTLLDESQAKL